MHMYGVENCFGPKASIIPCIMLLEGVSLGAPFLDESLEQMSRASILSRVLC